MQGGDGRLLPGHDTLVSGLAGRKRRCPSVPDRNSRPLAVQVTGRRLVRLRRASREDQGQGGVTFPESSTGRILERPRSRLRSNRGPHPRDAWGMGAGVLASPPRATRFFIDRVGRGLFWCRTALLRQMNRGRAVPPDLAPSVQKKPERFATALRSRPARWWRDDPGSGGSHPSRA